MGKLSHRDILPSESRYELIARIAAGGMATVYAGRLRAAKGVWRLVAIKRAHPHLLTVSNFAETMVAEAKLASRIHHANVVAVHDVEEVVDELLLVMDYVEGGSVSELRSVDADGRARLPADVVVRILLDACAGLQAAHDLLDDLGEPLGLVHRDISPQNILVGVDGAARITDFGIAKYQQVERAGTETGTLKGKLAYMAPEYIRGGHVTARSDIFGLAVVAWELFTGRRLFYHADGELAVIRAVLESAPPRLSDLVPALGTAFDGLLASSLEKVPAHRPARVDDFARALRDAAASTCGIASPDAVSEVVWNRIGPTLEARRLLIRDRIAADIPTSSPSARPSAPAPLPLEPSLALFAGPPTMSLAAEEPPTVADRRLRLDETAVSPPPALRVSQEEALTVPRLRVGPAPETRWKKGVRSATVAGIVVGAIGYGAWRTPRANSGLATPPSGAVSAMAPSVVPADVSDPPGEPGSREPASPAAPPSPPDEASADRAGSPTPPTSDPRATLSGQRASKAKRSPLQPYPRLDPRPPSGSSYRPPIRMERRLGADVQTG